MHFAAATTKKTPRIWRTAIMWSSSLPVWWNKVSYRWKSLDLLLLFGAMRMYINVALCNSSICFQCLPTPVTHCVDKPEETDCLQWNVTPGIFSVLRKEAWCTPRYTHTHPGEQSQVPRVDQQVFGLIGRQRCSSLLRQWKPSTKNPNMELFKCKLS